jgi:hypothetical protein
VISSRRQPSQRPTRRTSGPRWIFWPVGSTRRICVVQTALMLLIAGQANAAERGWYDVPAADQSIRQQIMMIAKSGVHVTVAFLDTAFWDSPALHNVHGWFTPLEAFCLALTGTPMGPVPVYEKVFAVHRHSNFPNEPQYCEYVTPDWGPEWIHPPQADWK